MRKPGNTAVGTVVLTVRMRARLTAFVALVTVLAILPFLAGTVTPVRQALLLSGDDQRDSVGQVYGPPTSVAEASPVMFGDPSAISQVAEAALSGAHGSGGGLLLFPSLSMAPLLFEAIAAPIAEQPGFIRPVDGPVASNFGPRIHPVLGRAMFHTGTDIMAPCGTPIKAAASGTVEYAAVSNSWGGRIIIAHTPTLKTAYGHLSKFIAHQGDVVRQGDIIGLVGTTGWSTGCHLHWDVIVNDRYVDPAPYLGLPASHAISIPFTGSGVTTAATPGTTPTTPAVPDGDVPIPAPTTTAGASTTAGVTTRPTGTPSTTTGTTTTTTTATSSSTTAPSTTTTTTPPTTTTGPPTTTTTTPPTTTTTTTSTTTTPPTTTSSSTTTPDEATPDEATPDEATPSEAEPTTTRISTGTSTQAGSETTTKVSSGTSTQPDVQTATTTATTAVTQLLETGATATTAP